MRAAALAVRVVLVRKAGSGTVAVEVVGGVRAAGRGVGCEVVAVVAVAVVVVAVRVAWTGCVSVVAVVCVYVSNLWSCRLCACVGVRAALVGLGERYSAFEETLLVDDYVWWPSPC